MGLSFPILIVVALMALAISVATGVFCWFSARAQDRKQHELLIGFIADLRVDVANVRAMIEKRISPAPSSPGAHRAKHGAAGSTYAVAQNS